MGDNTYSKGKIYKIVDNAYNVCYYGSTVQTLSNRMAKHRIDYYNYKNGDKNKFTTAFNIFDEYGIENCKIELVEMFPCHNKDELRKKEGEYIRQNSCVNKSIPCRSKQEWYVECREEIRNRQKQRYLINKDDIKQRVKDYRDRVKDTVEYKTRNKNYREANKEHKKEYDSIYRHKNMERIHAMRSEKVKCDLCGGCFIRNNTARHNRSDKHKSAKLQTYIQKLKDLAPDIQYVINLEILF